MDIYYDDNKNPIATSIDELILYFKSFDGTENVQNVPYILRCPMPALISIFSSNQSLPKFIYKNGTNPSDRIYMRQIPASSGAVDSLCSGVNSATLVPVPQLGSIEDSAIIVQIPDVGIITDADANSYILTLSDINGWIVDTSYSSTVNKMGIVTMNLSVKKHFSVTSFTNELIAQVSLQGRPNNYVTISSANNPNMPPSSLINIDSGGNIYYSGPAILVSGGYSIIEFFNLTYNILN